MEDLRQISESEEGKALTALAILRVVFLIAACIAAITIWAAIGTLPDDVSYPLSSRGGANPPGIILGFVFLSIGIVQWPFQVVLASICENLRHLTKQNDELFEAATPIQSATTEKER